MNRAPKLPGPDPDDGPTQSADPGAAHHTVPGRYWHARDDGRLQCDLCPRFCTLKDGARGLCFVRARQGSEIVLTTYGRSSGFCLDPIEKKPLNHFLPGTPVLSFGTAGCNLACKFCQNWEISKAREFDRLTDQASPEQIARAAVALGCPSVAFTYNDPVIFLEYAVDVAAACRAHGIAAVVVTAGEICPEPRAEFFAAMDATNIDLKAFSERFYRSLCGSHLAPVLDTLRYVRHETDVWLEITTLLIPGENDSDQELAALTAWIHDQLGAEVPLHFTAFRPEFRMREHLPTPAATLTRAREIGLAAGLRHVYTGNVVDRVGDATSCSGCGALLIERDRYQLLAYSLTPDGRCPTCDTPLAGRFNPAGPGQWGRRRQPVDISAVGESPHPPSKGR